MKTLKILLMVFLAVFLTAITVSAQDDVVPASDPFAFEDPFAPPAPPPPPGGGYYKSGGVPPGQGGVPPGQYKRVPEPSTLILLGIGLAAGGAYSFVRRQKSRERI